MSEKIFRLGMNSAIHAALERGWVFVGSDEYPKILSPPPGHRAMGMTLRWRRWNYLGETVTVPADLAGILKTDAATP